MCLIMHSAKKCCKKQPMKERVWRQGSLVQGLPPISGFTFPNSVCRSFNLSPFPMSSGGPNRVLQALDVLCNASVDLLRSHKTEFITVVMTRRYARLAEIVVKSMGWDGSSNGISSHISSTANCNPGLFCSPSPLFLSQKSAPSKYKIPGRHQKKKE